MADGLSSSEIRIDLSSDAQTRPSPGMRDAMSKAVVGDDQRREDPTVRELEERLCVACDKEAGLFLPSGTMCNIIALFVHCRPGDEVIAHRHSHVAYGELGGPSVHSRVALHLVDGPRGVIDAPTLSGVLRDRPYGLRAQARLLSLENTHNYAGGTIISTADQNSICTTARGFGLSTHLDGARLFNAAVATDVPIAAYCKPFDTVWVDLTKGLGCPAGSVLMGSESFIEEAVAIRRMFGGAMRQAGVLAAAGLYALDHNVERLDDDHRRARSFAAALEAAPDLAADPSSVETNIVHVDVAGGSCVLSEVLERTRSAGVRFGQVSESTIRAVTHLDLSDRDTKDAAAILHEAAVAVSQQVGEGEHRMHELDHIGIFVDDLTEAKRFLTRVLGLELDRELHVEELGVAAAFVRGGAVDLELIEVVDARQRRRKLGPGVSARIDHLAFRVQDLDEVVRRFSVEGQQLRGLPGRYSANPEPVYVDGRWSLWADADPTTVSYQFLQAKSQ